MADMILRVMYVHIYYYRMGEHNPMPSQRDPHHTVTSPESRAPSLPRLVIHTTNFVGK